VNEPVLVSVGHPVYLVHLVSLTDGFLTRWRRRSIMRLALDGMSHPTDWPTGFLKADGQNGMQREAGVKEVFIFELTILMEPIL
jgi:hypothetical protein